MCQNISDNYCISMNRLTELADPYLRKSHLVTERGVARTQLFYAQTGKILKKYLPRVAATIGTTLSERICFRREQKFESIDFVISKCRLLKCLPTIRKHAYSNILKISPPQTEHFQIKILIFFIFLLET